MHNLVIVGAGPAGIATAIEGYLQGIRDIILLEKDANPNSTIRKYYKDNKRVDKDWKGQKIKLDGRIFFVDGTKESTLNFFDQLISHHSVKIQNNSEAQKIKKLEDGTFEVQTSSGNIKGKNVVVTIGRMGKPNKPSYKIPSSIKSRVHFSLEECGTNENILVVGGGDSAIEYAIELSSSNNVTICYRRGTFRRANPQNQEDIANAINSNKLTAKLNLDVINIEEENGLVKAIFDDEDPKTYDRVIYAIGGTTPSAFLASSGIKEVDGKPVYDENYQTDVSGLFVAGDITQESGGSIVLGLNQGYAIACHIQKRIQELKLSKGKRVGIIGVGNVGATVAYSLAMHGVCHEIVLCDNKKDVSRGKALDMSQAASVVRSHTVVRVADEIEEMKDCDVVVISAGSPRLPGMSRDDLLMTNANITKDVVKKIAKVSPDAILIMVSNPLDAMTYVALKESGFSKNQVLGMAGILDSSRMAAFIQEELGYGGGQIRALVLGGHGDTMVALPKYSTVAGVPLSDLLSQEQIDKIIERTKKSGAEIVGYLKTASAYYAPAKATAIMVEAILKDTKQIHPCAVLLEGEYGYKDVVVGVPVMIGANGAEKVIEISLSTDEKQMLDNSCGLVKKSIDTLKNNNFFNPLAN